MEALLLMGTAESMVGTVLEDLGRDDEALSHFRADLRIMQRLTAHDPDNAVWQRDRAVTELFVGSVLVRQGELDGAEPLLRAALATTEELVARSPDMKDWRENVVDCRLGVVRLELARNRSGAALAQVERAEEELTAVLRDNPDDRTVIQRMGSLLLLRGVALDRSGRTGPARESWNEALSLLADSDESADESRLVIQASALIRLGRAREADELVRSLTATGYAATDFVALCNEHGIATTAAS
jgi:tetratricopeptide (TPR) repeat protein